MIKIQKKDINFRKLKKLQSQGSQSIIYCDKKYCYKMFNNANNNYCKSIQRLYRDLEGYNNPNILLPVGYIMTQGKLEGYIMEKKDAYSIVKNFEEDVHTLSCPIFFFIIKQVSEILRQLHSDGIVVTDLNFNNILIDNKTGQVYYADTDSFSYRKTHGFLISELLYNYLKIHKLDTNYRISENTDRLSLALAFLHTMYYIPFDKITTSYFDEYSYINTLTNMRQLFFSLKTAKTLPQVGYIDKFLDLNDNAEIKRNSQIKLIKQKTY